jgi:hypothetical protein
MFENRKVIVTLTTIPSRLKYLIHTLSSLLAQSIKPDEIVISLPKNSVREPNEGDPYEITQMLQYFINKYNITILRCKKDYGPGTKLLGLLEREIKLNLPKEKEALIITVDDDKIYDTDTVKYLLEGWKRNKHCVVARKGSIITKLGKKNKLYLNNKLHFDKIDRFFEQVIKGNEISQDTKVSTVFGTGGILYRASYFKEDIFDYKKHNIDFPEKKFFTLDDIYFSGYLGKNNIIKKIIKFPKTKYHLIIDEKMKKDKHLRTTIDKDTLNREINPLININLINDNQSNSIYCVKYFESYLCV